MAGASAANPSLIVVDPDEVGSLYHRCVRCLYLRYRAGQAAEKGVEQNWADTIVGYHSESEDGWNEAMGQRFRFRLYGEHVESRPVRFKDVPVMLSFSGRYDALLDLEDGTIVLAKCMETQARPNPHQHQWSLSGFAFALKNPRSAGVEPIDVTKAATLEFDTARAANGRSIVTPSRLAFVPHDPKRFLQFAGIVARVLAAPTPPAKPCAICKAMSARAR